MPTLWSAIEVAELTGKTAQKVPPWDLERKPGKGGCGKGDKGAKVKSRDVPIVLAVQEWKVQVWR